MRTIATIVEGFGEVRALPVLLRRLAADAGTYDLTVPEPFRVPRTKITDAREMSRAVRVCQVRAADGGAVLVLVDGDDDCPVELADRIRTACGPVTVPLFTVVAVREYESMFLAAADSLATSGHFANADLSIAPESVRGAKEQIGRVIAGGTYRETVHQAKLSAVVTLDEARRCSWVRKLERDLRCVLGG